jgi:hypothetical protein
MRKLILVSLLAVGLAGCSKPSLADLKKLKEEACACKTVECGKKVEKKLENLLGNASEADVGNEGMSVSIDAMMCAKKAQMGMFDDDLPETDK